MQGARGLAAAEEIDGGGERGVEGGREREAGPDDEGEEDEDDEAVGGALDDVVGVGLQGMGRTAAEMAREDGAEGSPVAVGGLGKQIAREVAVEQACCSVDEGGEHEHP